jgi:hypothetical protein
MAIARSHLVSVALTRWYHRITRCARRAFLLGVVEADGSRKDWIEQPRVDRQRIFLI